MEGASHERAHIAQSVEYVPERKVHGDRKGHGG